MNEPRGVCMNQWKGVVIAESLHDPTKINLLQVYRTFITHDGVLTPGDVPMRWHLYWVRASRDDVAALRDELKHGWYIHFWNAQKIIVLYDDADFEMDRFDRSTWKAATDHGLAMGIPIEQLDFPTDDSTGTLE